MVRDLVYYEGVLFDHATRVQAGRGEIDGFVEALTSLKDSPAAYAKAQRSAREGAARYSRASVAEKWREFYRSQLTR